MAKMDTVTIKNTTGKLFEFMWNYEMHYLQPDQEWTLEKRIGQALVNKWEDQLEVVGEGAMLSIPPTEDPNVSKSYDELHPKSVKESGKSHCKQCGKQFNGSGQLMMHKKKHEKEARQLVEA